MRYHVVGGITGSHFTTLRQRVQIGACKCHGTACVKAFTSYLQLWWGPFACATSCQESYQRFWLCRVLLRRLRSVWWNVGSIREQDEMLPRDVLGAAAGQGRGTVISHAVIREASTSRTVDEVSVGSISRRRLN